MTISLRLSDEDGNTIKQYAEAKGISASEFIRVTCLNAIEDEKNGKYRVVNYIGEDKPLKIGNVGNPDIEIELL